MCAYLTIDIATVCYTLCIAHSMVQIARCGLHGVDVRSEMGSHQFRGSSHDPSRLLNHHHSPINVKIHKISSILLINPKSCTISNYPCISEMANGV